MNAVTTNFWLRERTLQLQWQLVRLQQHNGGMFGLSHTNQFLSVGGFVAARNMANPVQQAAVRQQQYQQFNPGMGQGLGGASMQNGGWNAQPGPFNGGGMQNGGDCSSSQRH